MSECLFDCGSDESADFDPPGKERFYPMPVGDDPERPLVEDEPTIGARQHHGAAGRDIGTAGVAVMADGA